MRVALMSLMILLVLPHPVARAWSVTENWGAGPQNTGRAQIPNALSNSLDDTYIQPAQLATLKNIQANMGLLLETPFVAFQNADGTDKSDR